MKTKLTLALAALALNTNANVLNVTRHDFSLLEFYITPVTGVAHELYFGTLPQSQAVIAASVDGAGDIAVNVRWNTASYSITDDLLLSPPVVVGFDGTSYSYDQPSGNWLFHYENPNPYVPPQVPDNGSVLVGLGAAIIGVWRLKR